MYDYEEDRKDCAYYTDEKRFINLSNYVGRKVKVRCDTWGNVWNFKTDISGKYLMGEIVSVTRTKKQTLMKIRAEHNVSWKRPCKRYPISAIGETVFIEKGGDE